MMEQLLTEEDRPTAIYCANDISAVGMLKCMANNKKCGYMPSITILSQSQQSFTTIVSYDILIKDEEAEKNA